MQHFRFRMGDWCRFSKAEPLDSASSDLPDGVTCERLLRELFLDLKSYYLVGTKDSTKDKRSIENELETNSGVITGIKNLNGKISRIVTLDDQEYRVSLDIVSKFDVTGCEDQQEVKPWFLVKLLSVLKDEAWSDFWLQDNEYKDDQTDGSEEDQIAILVFWLFQSMVKRACRKGVYREYQWIEHNDERLNGALDVARHIRLNMGQDDTRIAYRKRERTADNAINRLILCTWDYLCEKYPHLASIADDPAFHDAIKTLRGLVTTKRLRPIDCIKENVRPIASPYHMDHEELRRSCLRILWDEGASYYFGEDNDLDRICGVLIYTPTLWEDLLEQALERYLPKDDLFMERELSCPAETASSLLKGYMLFREGYMFFREVAEKKNKDIWQENDQTKILLDAAALLTDDPKQEVRPDLIWYPKGGRKTDACLILDAKLKYENDLENTQKHKDGFPKLHRDLVVYYLEDRSNTTNDFNTIMTDFIQKKELALPWGGLIYPRNTQNADSTQKQDEDDHYNLHIPVTLPPYDRPYDEWSASFERALKDAVNKINGHLKSAKGKKAGST